MTTRSLILSPHEVRAALDGQLGLVVRPVKGLGDVKFTRAHFSSFHSIWGTDAWVFEASIPDGGVVSRGLQCSLGTTGTHLECKEPWARLRGQGFVFREGYVSDLPEAPMRPKWRSPATMPAWASRITLEVVGVRCVRVDRLYESEAERTGIGPELVPPDGGGSPHKEGLRTFWKSKYGRRYPWETSWAWAVGVRRVEA